jgi:hypothetical protein
MQHENVRVMFFMLFHAVSFMQFFMQFHTETTCSAHDGAIALSRFIIPVYFLYK